MAHGGKEARLGAIGGLGLPARLGQLGLGETRLGDVAALRLHLRHRPVRGGHDVLLPLEPARTGGSFDLLHIALVADHRARSQRPRPLAREHVRPKGLAEHGRALAPEHAAERLVDEGQAAFGVAPQDHVGLVVEQVAIARLVLPDLPLQVLELFQALLEAIADAREAFEFGGQIAIGHRRTPEPQWPADTFHRTQYLQPAF